MSLGPYIENIFNNDNIINKYKKIDAHARYRMKWKIKGIGFSMSHNT